MNIGLVTDSTCDLNNNIISKYNIEIVPLTIHFGTEKFIDGIEIDSLTFFNKIQNESNIPKTSKPSKYDFMDKYKKMLNDKKYDKIISIHVSKGLSGTYESAKLAAKEIGEDRITVIDSSSISLGLGFQVLYAINLINKNQFDYKQIVKHIKEAKNHISCIFTVEDLTYMKKGGRIGSAEAFLGNIFNISPIIEISPLTGKVNPLDKIRGNKKTLKKMSELLIDRIKGYNYNYVGIMHGDRPNLATKLLNNVKNNITDNISINFIENRISPTLGCHVGPSVYAFATFSNNEIQI